MAPRSLPGFLSRRHFLRNSGGGVVAASALAAPALAQGGGGSLPTQATGRPMPKMEVAQPDAPGRRVGYAVLGLGQYALNQIIPAFGETQHSRLVALVSGNRQKAEGVADRYGVRREAIYGYQDLERIAENDEIDVVYVITPPSLHEEFTVRSLRAGKHVLCEKPMAPSVEACQRMIDAARQADRQLMIGYRCHYEPYSLEAIRRIRAGELGEVRVLHTDNARPVNPDSVPADEWRVRRALAGGGALFDVGIYGVNGARYLLGAEPEEVSAWSHTPDDPRFGDVEDVTTWRMRFPGGVTVLGSTGYSYQANRFAVQGSKASLLMEPATHYYRHGMSIRTQQKTEQLLIPEASQFARQLDHMAEAIREGQPVHSPGEEGMQDVRLMLAMYRAAQTGQPVKIDWSYRRAARLGEAG
ncbi:Gfo/Idh/MocA family protein [Pseudoroseomonas cervicalis]|uniref:Gfo/Idh/MocA family protein n=1 Tax=Teichococcus cervicalis TaxID=204525 RepID=UPI0022F1999A|nr:Gfo/Idh/MocA family oxidoreductase [Pseudoroseomonas cervicalis]WBV43953.1 Gfo/Idh/MocA family oxidoreductase [Pseudoroseomonas cervicalis]